MSLRFLRRWLMLLWGSFGIWLARNAQPREVCEDDCASSLFFEAQHSVGGLGSDPGNLDLFSSGLT